MFALAAFLQDATGTVIVLPSPHNAYKDGRSYRDTCAMGEIFARLQNRIPLEVRIPEQLGSDIRKNLILIAGPKTNSITRELYATQGTPLVFRLAGEVSDERYEIGHGVFTYYLLEGQKGKADINRMAW